MAFNNLAKRVAVAVVGVPAVLACVWFGSWYYFILMTLIAVVAGYEFLTFTANKGMNANPVLTLLAIPVLFLLVYLQLDPFLLPFLAGLVIVLLLGELMRKTNNAILSVAGSLLIIGYIGILYSFLLMLRELPVAKGLDYEVGAIWVFLILAATWICDTAAYFVGSRFGRHKLAPQTSPNKTIEGGLGGAVGAVLTAFIIHKFFETGLSDGSVILIGVLIGVFGQLSDLVESLFKRDAGVKDSSSILPGHGGILDRFDSELLSVPLIYFYLNYFAL